MQSGTTVKVWDPFVRVFHWALVALFLTAYLTEGEVMPLHAWAGYGILILLGLRVVWGFVGTRHARFADFVRGPGAVMADLRSTLTGRVRHYLGHDPAGGAMILMMMAALLGTGLLGMMLLGIEEHAGPLAGWTAGMGEDSEEVIEEAHEVLANLSLLLVLLHIAAVLLVSVLRRENLTRAMFTGRKRRRA